ncbi:MAG: polysaccharide biosynthesis tyrosine autokinase [Acidimicrobiales bacterium]|nr:polysaccharide biosynthesis tyrosine autokinase [Acidimicrobiales bacterium]
MVPDNNFVQDDVTTLEDYLAAIRNRKWVVVAVASLVFALAFLATSGGVATYTAEGEVEVGLSPVNSTNDSPAPGNLDLERSKMKGNEISTAVAGQFQASGIPVTAAQLREDIDVSFVPSSQRLDLSFTSDDPEFAAAVVNAFAETYVQRRKAAAEEYYETRINVLLATEQAELEKALAAETARVELVQEAAAANTTQARRAQIQIELAEFQDIKNDANRAIAIAKTERNRQELNRASLQSAASVILSADTPTSVNGVPRSYILVGSLIAGLLFGTAAAFLAERLDTTARDEEDVALALNTRVLASIPAFPLGNRSGTSAAVMLSEDRKPRLAISREAFRRLRSSIQFSAASTGSEVFLFTSAFPGEGKSVAASNLALALAQSGKHVALVSADMRRPTLERILGVPNNEGLSDFLGGRTEMELKSVEGVENLWFVPSGPAPANPGELLGSVQFETLIKELRTMASFVIIDSPPVLSTADAATAAAFVDGVVVIVDSRRTETPDLIRVRDELERGGAKIAGAVLNRTRGRRGLFSRRDTYAYYETGQS